MSSEQFSGSMSDEALVKHIVDCKEIYIDLVTPHGTTQGSFGSLTATSEALTAWALELAEGKKNAEDVANSKFILEYVKSLKQLFADHYEPIVNRILDKVLLDSKNIKLLQLIADNGSVELLLAGKLSVEKKLDLYSSLVEHYPKRFKKDTLPVGLSPNVYFHNAINLLIPRKLGTHQPGFRGRTKPILDFLKNSKEVGLFLKSNAKRIKELHKKYLDHLKIKNETRLKSKQQMLKNINKIQQLSNVLDMIDNKIDDARVEIKKLNFDGYIEGKTSLDELKKNLKNITTKNYQDDDNKKLKSDLQKLIHWVGKLEDSKKERSIIQASLEKLQKEKKAENKQESKLNVKIPLQGGEKKTKPDSEYLGTPRFKPCVTATPTPPSRPVSTFKPRLQTIEEKPKEQPKEHKEEQKIPKAQPGAVIKKPSTNLARNEPPKTPLIVLPSRPVPGAVVKKPVETKRVETKQEDIISKTSRLVLEFNKEKDTNKKKKIEKEIRDDLPGLSENYDIGDKVSNKRIQLKSKTDGSIAWKEITDLTSKPKRTP